jgi:SAM-dependent methyltransferase
MGRESARSPSRSSASSESAGGASREPAPGLTSAENLALDHHYISPVSRRALRPDVGSATFATADGTERFRSLAGEIPDLRVDKPLLDDHEISALRQRLGRWWDESQAAPVLPAALVPATPAAARRYWRITATSELKAFAAWWARRRPRYTQRDSMQLYRGVADVYAAAARRSVTVLTAGGVATVPLAHFKRLSLEPLLQLMRDRGVRSVLDFGCGWGANTVILRQLMPGLEVWSFDYSPQRVLTTQFNLRALGLVPYRLFVADGSRLPLADASVDVVLTTHVLEQMGEVLPRALDEIHRVARRFAYHVEPSWRWGRWPHRLRMRRLGYPRDIAERSVALGWRLLTRRPADPGWGRVPGELIVLEKAAGT